MRGERRTWIAVMMCLIICLAPMIPAAAENFTVKRIGNLIPFNDNAFSITAPEKGRLTIRIHDDISVYRTLEQEIEAGETTIHWDGCAYNHEKLASKNYIITAVLEGASGEEYTVSFNTPVEYTGQCLQYLLPSSDRVSTAEPEEWFVEFRTVQKGTVTFLFRNTETGETAQTYSVNTTGGRINRLTFTELTGKKPLPAGTYRIMAYENSRQAEKHEFDLTIQEEPPAKEEIFLTGEILPGEEMTEEEIWQIMQAPSVVVDIDFFKHQKVYTRKDRESASLGTLHGQTQALKVMQIEDGWAFIGAWNHEEAEYVEGWVPASVLKVVHPDTEYGILINKRKQTLDVYCQGKRIDTLQVSTGRPEEKHPEQETAAGSFLTGYHRVDFSMNGKKYDYVIQYDGGNLLHQIPYEWGKDKKDFSYGRSFLGAKASHACIRIQSEPGENGINAYWIWAHIPYRTRVIILDDPAERRPVEEGPEIITEEPETGENQVRLTFEDEKRDENVKDPTVIEEIGGKRIGYALCGEKEYVRNPGIIDERIRELREKGCEKIILKCFWNDRNAEKHSAVQEGMARKGVRAGADLVIGNGNRQFLGCEWQGNALILYGLGEQKTKKAGKRGTTGLTAEIIFTFGEEKSRPTAVIRTASPDEDPEQTIERFRSDSLGEGISRILFLTGDQSKQ